MWRAAEAEHVRWTRGGCMVSVVVAAALVLVVTPQAERPMPTVGVCEREGAAIVGSRPGTPSRKGFPRKRVHKKPEWPALPGGTSVAGNWLGELLIRADGTVARVWSLREPKLEPAFPPFNEAIVKAVGQWQYEPWMVGGRATPFCVTVAMTVDF